MKQTLLFIITMFYGLILSAQSDGDYKAVGNGNWNSLSLWERHNGTAWVAASSVPGITDGIINIGDGFTVTISSPVSVDQIVVQNSGTLAVAGGNLSLADNAGEDLLVSGTLYLQGGTIGGPGSVMINSGATFYVGNYAATSQTLASNLTNNGSIVFAEGYGGCCASSNLVATGITINNNGNILVTAGDGISSVTIIGGTLLNNPTGVITNNSTFAAYGSNNGFYISSTQFINNGQLVTLAGRIYITVSDPSTHNGVFTSNTGHSIIFNTSGIQTFTAGSSFNGGGAIVFNSGTHNLLSAYSAGITTVNGGTVNFNQASVNFNSVNLYSGVFGGSAAKNVLNSMVWVAGTTSGGELINSSGGTVYCGAGSTSQGTLAANFTNNGVVQFSNDYGGCCIGPVFSMAGAVFQNNGSIQVYGYGGIYHLTLSGGTLINNPSGVISSNTNYSIYAGDNAAFYISTAEFVNNGSLLTTQGKVVISSTVSATHNGSFTNNSSSPIVFNTSGIQNYTSSSSFGGTGRMTFTAGTHILLSSYSPGATTINGAVVNFNQSNVNFTSVNLDSGTFGGSSTKTILTNLFWGYGTVSGGELINTATGAVYLGAGSTTQGILETTFTNNGYAQIFNSYGGCCTGPIFNMTSGTINNNGTFDILSSGGISYVGLSGGTFNNNATGVLNCNPASYYSLIYLTPSTLTSTGVININNISVSVPSCTLGGQINISAGGSLQTGTVSFNGTSIVNNGSVALPNFIFSGSSPQNASGSGSYEYVSMNGSGGVVLGSNLTIYQGLTLTNGKIVTGNYLVDAGQSQTTVSTGNAGSYVAGKLLLYLHSGNASRVFPVGTPNYFAPATIAFNSISSPGGLIVSVNPGDHPAIASSGINANRSVNAHWLLVNAGLVYNNYNATFGWVPGLLDGIANPLAFNIRRYNAGVWNNVAESAAGSASILGSGITSFGEFQIAEIGCDAVTYYRDQDSDGYGNIADVVNSCIPVAGYVLNSLDCNDTNAQIKPGAVEICGNGIDEDCDGQVDEGCGQASNDTPFSAHLIVLAGNTYPYCGVMTGSLSNATDSPQSATYSGPDAWYRFVAASPSVSIAMSGSNHDNIIVLYTDALTLVPGNNTANDQPLGGAETLFYNNLTVGQQYYISVGSVGGTPSAYTLCLRQLLPSFCVNGSAQYSLCANLKPQWTGATSYTFNITPTGDTPGTPVSFTAPGQLALSNPALGLQYEGTYNVRVDAHYLSLTYANGNPAPPVTVIGIQTANIVIEPHLLVETKLGHQCPSGLLKRTILQAKPFICSTVNFTVEFTRVSACSGGTVIDMPFEVTTPGSTSNLPLGFVSPQPLVNNAYYKVRWRPNFAYGAGNWGPVTTIHISGSIMQETELMEEDYDLEKSETSEIQAALYPNPNNGYRVNLNVTGIESEKVLIRVTDAVGREVFNAQYSTENSLNTIIHFNQQLAGGMYLIEIRSGEKILTQKLFIERQ